MYYMQKLKQACGRTCTGCMYSSSAAKAELNWFYLYCSVTSALVSLDQEPVRVKSEIFQRIDRSMNGRPTTRNRINM